MSIAATEPSLDSNSLSFISTLVRKKSAIVLDENKSYLIESRLAPIVRDNGMKSIVELVGELRKPFNNELAQQVVEAMTTNETSFFRDLHPFNALKDKVLPELIQKRASKRSLVIWSNACSSGQEPYSIAILIRENFPELIGWNIKIIATDICNKVLDRARTGVFNQTEVNRGLPMQLLMKHFQRQGTKWVVDENVRKMIDFRILNLVEPWHGIPMADVVFLRNVLIYFDLDTKTQILNQIHQTIQKDGFLFLGGSETTMNLNVSYEREQDGKAVIYRPA